MGDDLTVSNRALLEQAIDKGSINAIIIKPNQIGTLSEMFLTMQLARANGIEIIVSHRGRRPMMILSRTLLLPSDVLVSRRVLL